MCGLLATSLAGGTATAAGRPTLGRGAGRGKHRRQLGCSVAEHLTLRGLGLLDGARKNRPATDPKSSSRFRQNATAARSPLTFK
jgi:hypothetical protein